MKNSILTAVLLFTLAASAFSQTFTGDQKQSLKGLNALLLMVEFTEAATVEADGLKKDELETAIAARLRSSGIRLLSQTEWSSTPGVPYLQVLVNTLKSDLGFYSYKIDVQLNQEIVLKRNNIAMMSTTWNKGALGHIGTTRVPAIRNDIMGYVNEFIQDYRAVNAN
ncbi:MAG: hypothetical protein LC662_04020 [Rhodothermaceae bacterium]|nr:hypothetical protein [Rhodothermaceae bacterium]